MDPADAYVEIYDTLRGCAAGLLSDWSENAAVKSAAEQVRRDVEADGELSERWLPGATGHPSPELLGVLLGLDRALLNANGEADALSTRTLGYLRSRLQIHGRLNDGTSGSLLFRRARSARPNTEPQTLGDFLNLVRVPASARVHIVPVAEVLDLPDRGVANSEELDVLPRLPVAQFPMLAERADLRWRQLNNNGRKFYSVGPDDSLSAHVSDVLAAADASGAVLALLPEASLSDHLVRSWRDTLANTPRPDDSQLTWLMVGTGPVTEVGGPATCNRPTNRAVLLHRRGDVLLTQDKQRGFTFTAGQQTEYEIDLGGTRDEYLAQGTSLALLEARYGRFGVLICEDADQHSPQSDIIAVGATHLLVPILAAAMWDQGWQAVAAKRFVMEAGTDVAVCNGVAFHRFVPFPHAPRPPLALKPAPTLLIITAPPGHTGEWPSHDDLVTAHAAPDSVAALDARTDALMPRLADW